MLGHSQRSAHFLIIAAFACLVLALGVPSAHAQAVYGSISGTVRDNTGAILPGATVTVTSVERSTTDTVVTNESGLYIKDRLLPGAYEVRAELQGFKQARVPSRQRQRGHANAGRLHAGARRAQRNGRGDRRFAAAPHGSRRRGHQVRRAPVDRPPGARPQLHEVRPADARHAAAGLAACGQRKPARVDADDGERAALQRDDLPARRYREPRSDPRHHRHQPDAGVDPRNENHLAELRRRVRTGHGRGRVGADQVGHERAARQRLRVLPERQVPVAQSVHAVPADP